MNIDAANSSRTNKYWKFSTIITKKGAYKIQINGDAYILPNDYSRINHEGLYIKNNLKGVNKLKSKVSQMLNGRKVSTINSV